MLIVSEVSPLSSWWGVWWQAGLVLEKELRVLHPGPKVERDGDRERHRDREIETETDTERVKFRVRL